MILCMLVAIYLYDTNFQQVVWRDQLCGVKLFMMTSCYGNIFCIAGPLWGEPVTGGLPAQKDSNVESISMW